MTSTPSVQLASSVTQNTSPWVQAAELNDKARKEAELANTECQNAAQWCCSQPAVSQSFFELHLAAAPSHKDLCTSKSV